MAGYRWIRAFALATIHEHNYYINHIIVHIQSVIHPLSAARFDWSTGKIPDKRLQSLYFEKGWPYSSTSRRWTSAWPWGTCRVVWSGGQPPKRTDGDGGPGTYKYPPCTNEGPLRNRRRRAGRIYPERVFPVSAWCGCRRPHPDNTIPLPCASCCCRFRNICHARFRRCSWKGWLHAGRASDELYAAPGDFLATPPYSSSSSSPASTPSPVCSRTRSAAVGYTRNRNSSWNRLYIGCTRGKYPARICLPRRRMWRHRLATDCIRISSARSAFPACIRTWARPVVCSSSTPPCWASWISCTAGTGTWTCAHAGRYP